MNPNSCASISSAISSICLGIVLAKILATFENVASPKSSQQMSLAAVRINFSPIVKGFPSFKNIVSHQE